MIKTLRSSSMIGDKSGCRGDVHKFAALKANVRSVHDVIVKGEF